MANFGKTTQKQRRLYRTRNKVKQSDRPRLSVHKTGMHIYAQVIDDSQGKTIAFASTVDKDLRKKLKSTANVDAAQQVGTLLAKRAKDSGVTKVVFDRGSFLYHGRIKALADAAREGGMEF